MFDLVPLATGRLLILLSLYWTLETIYMQQFESPHDYKLFLLRRVLHASIGAFHFVFLVYTFTKASIVLSLFIKDSSYAGMSSTFYAALICSCVFVLIEILTYINSFKSYKLLVTLRVRHIFNAEGKEVDENGIIKKRRATLLRLLKLARPVRA